MEQKRASAYFCAAAFMLGFGVGYIYHFNKTLDLQFENAAHKISKLICESDLDDGQSCTAHYIPKK